MNTATNKLTTIIAADDQISKQMDQIAAHAENKLAGITKAGQRSSSMLSKAFGVLGQAVGAIFRAIATAAAVAFAAATAAAEEFFRRSLKQAMEIQGSYVALAMVGKSLGIPGSNLEKIVQETRKIGIEWGAAVQTLTQWLTAGLPIDKFQTLARSAQDLAKASGLISSEVFQDLVEAIQSGETMSLHKYGMVAPITQVLQRHAPKEYQNTPIQDLPEQVRFAAMLAYILKSLEPYAGAYETTLGRAVGLWASMDRHVKELMKFFGILGLGALLDMLQWATKFVEKLKEMTKEGHGIAAPMIFVSSIIRTLVGGFGNAEQAAKKLSDWMDKTISAENAGKAAKWIMYAVAGFHLMLAILKSVGAALLFIAQVAIATNPFAWITLGAGGMKQLIKDLNKAQQDMAKGTFGEFGKAKDAFNKAGTVGEKVKDQYGNATEAARKAMEELIKVMGYSVGVTGANTAALNAATQKDKPFGGGERFQRYSGMLGQRHGGGAPISVHVHGSASYGAGAADMAGALGDAMSRRLAGAMGPGLSGAGS